MARAQPTPPRRFPRTPTTSRRLPQRTSKSTPVQTGRFRPRRSTPPPKPGPTQAVSGAVAGQAGRLGGLAIVTAAGFAFRNRDKLMGLISRRRSVQGATEAVPVPAVPPTHPTPVPNSPPAPADLAGPPTTLADPLIPPPGVPPTADLDDADLDARPPRDPLA